MIVNIKIIVCNNFILIEEKSLKIYFEKDKSVNIYVCLCLCRRKAGQEKTGVPTIQNIISVQVEVKSKHYLEKELEAITTT